MSAPAARFKVLCNILTSFVGIFGFFSFTEYLINRDAELVKLFNCNKIDNHSYHRIRYNRVIFDTVLFD